MDKPHCVSVCVQVSDLTRRFDASVADGASKDKTIAALKTRCEGNEEMIRLATDGAKEATQVRTLADGGQT